MFNPPKTLEEAKTKRYGTWEGMSNGIEYYENYCAYEVFSGGRGWFSYQCTRKNGHGINKLYCKQHAKMNG